MLDVLTIVFIGGMILAAILSGTGGRTRNRTLFPEEHTESRPGRREGVRIRDIQTRLAMIIFLISLVAGAGAYLLYRLGWY